MAEAADSSIYPPARLSPSAAPAIDCTLGEPIPIGPRLPLRGSPDMARLGDAVHGFCAADRGSLAEADRVAVARGLLDRFGVAAHLDAADLVADTEPGYLLVDHKSFPGSTEAAVKRAATYTGQLRLYADAIERATGRPVTALALHLPVLGLLVPTQA